MKKDDEKVIDSGAIYIFNLNKESGFNIWIFSRKYLATDGAPNDQLGSGAFDISLHALSFSTSGLIAGAQSDDGTLGAAYFFNYPN